MIKKYKIIMIIFIIISSVFTAFIFYNSIQEAKQSNERSKAIVNKIKSITNSNELSDAELNERVRKTAHVLEFAGLGISLTAVMKCLGKIKNRKYICFPILIALHIAVIDEFIQSFNDRSSVVRDIFIDYGGALCGMLIAVLIVKAYSSLRQKHFQFYL